MRKRILLTLALSVMMAAFAVPFCMGQNKDFETVSTTAQETTTTTVSENETIAAFENVENKTKQETIEHVVLVQETISEEEIRERRIGEAKQKMNEINNIKDKQEWFASYKKIINEYSDVIDPPETIYDMFPSDHLDLLFRVVHAEIGDEWTFEHKVNVASVIYNRIESEHFGNSLITVLIPGQFSTISNGAYKNKPSQKTIDACEYAFMFENANVGDALFFDSNGVQGKSSKLECVYRDGAHYFYQLKEKK